MRHLWLLVCLGILPRAVEARADTLRLAIVVGNNLGHDGRPPLHFAEDDAGKFARVLTELGGVSPANLYLLQGKTKEVLDETFDRVTERVGALHRAPGHRATLIFYFSGHSDGEALELGQGSFPFTELRRRLKASGAEVRVAIADSCRSGGLLAAKGGRLSQPFDIRLSDDAAQEGAVLLASSAANEDALESSEIRGSFFTHHLISGLRGAADVSGDGRVTLAEAYKYAYDRTLAATARTIAGPQHPSYDIRLAGVGELVLTQLTRPSGALVLPSGFDRALISEPTRDEVLAEIPAGAPGRVAVPPGDYLVRLWRSGSVYSGRILVGQNEARTIAWTNLQPARLSLALTTAKGGPDLSAADLAEGIRRYHALDYPGAAGVLHAVVNRQPEKNIAARAHLYLGIIALNLSNLDESKSEFRMALDNDPTSEIPFEASPKARMTFALVRRDFDRELQSQPAVAVAPPSADVPPAKTISVAPAPPTLIETAAPEPTVAIAAPAKPSSHPTALSIVLGSAGIVVGAAAVYGGIQVLNYNNTVKSANNNPGAISSTQAGPESLAQFWSWSWIVLAGLGAAGVTGAILTW